MREVADGVWHIALTPRDAVNAYVLGDVLVDAGTKGLGRKLPRALHGHPVAAHAITHAHPDHIGGSRSIVDAFGVPFWAPAGDAEAAEQGAAVPRVGPLQPVAGRVAGHDRVTVDRRLGEGDEIGAGFVVLDTPGHSPGQVSYWRERDRILVCGDVWFNMHFTTMRPRLGSPFRLSTVDPARNRESQRRLTALRPDIVLFGHGPVMTGAADRLRVF